MDSRTSATIPNFIRASSLSGLRRSMLLNNARLGAFVPYFDIQQVKEKNRTDWIAFYFEPTDLFSEADRIREFSKEGE